MTHTNDEGEEPMGSSCCCGVGVGGDGGVVVGGEDLGSLVGSGTNH